MLILALLLLTQSVPSFTVVNRTRQNIDAVWEGAHALGQVGQVDYLGADGREGQPGITEVIAPGKARSFRSEFTVDQRCRADLRITFEDRSERNWRNVKLCHVKRWIIRPISHVAKRNGP